MFKLPLLWKFHVASLSKKKNQQQQQNPPMNWKLNLYLFRNMRYLKISSITNFFLFSISSIKLMLLYHVVPCPMTVSKSTASHCTVYSMESDANFTEQIFFV